MRRGDKFRRCIGINRLLQIARRKIRDDMTAPEETFRKICAADAERLKKSLGR